MQSRSCRPAVLLVALVAAVSACSNGSPDAAPAPTPPATTAPAAPADVSDAASDPTSRPAAAADPATCFLGTFDVVSITGKQGVATPFGTVRPAGTGGSLILDLRADNTWRLRGDGARPVTFQVDQYTVDARIDGTLSGTYRRSGTTFVFKQEDADGTVTLATPVGAKEYDMDAVGSALAPAGAATITCGPGTVDFTSESVTMTLKRH
jgi:hypothetical protein